MTLSYELILGVIGLVITLVGTIVGFNVWLAVTINRIEHSIKYINTNLRLIDWEKVPKKNMNEII